MSRVQGHDTGQPARRRGGHQSVTMRIEGENAYGLLQGEKGIHRLIRISPFDSSGRRHTSFASVDLLPDAGDEISIEIKESDLRIDVYRASGAGGQHVNKTESAVRITHLPTGIVAQCQNEKSQHSNRESAMRILKARLYEHERSKRDAAKQADYAGKDAIAFGSQIRTYTLQPYRLVKDHRTGSEMGDVDAVLDGRISQFLRDYLLYRSRTGKSVRRGMEGRYGSGNRSRHESGGRAGSRLTYSCVRGGWAIFGT